MQVYGRWFPRHFFKSRRKSVAVVEPTFCGDAVQVEVAGLFFMDNVETILYPPLIEVFTEIRPGRLIDIGG